MPGTGCVHNGVPLGTQGQRAAFSQKYWGPNLINKSPCHQNIAKTNMREHFKLSIRLEKTTQSTMKIKLLNIFHSKNDSDFIFKVFN